MKRILSIVVGTVICVGVPFVSADRAAGQSGDRHRRGRLVLRRASLRQRGQLVLRLRTYRAWGPAVLRGPSHPYLCVQLFRAARKPRRQICVKSRRSRTNFGLGLVSYALSRSGSVRARKGLTAQIERLDDRSLSARFLASDAGLEPGRWHWRIVSASSRGSCRSASGLSPGCADEFPAAGTRPLRIRPAHLVGCTPGGPSYLSHGSRTGREVALSFDDGPSSFTAAIIDVLHRYAARATFNVVGNRIAGNGKLLVRELEQGDEIGNHTWNHANVAGDGSAAYEELVRTNAAITHATGFQPCVFRAPYGAVSNRLIGVARTLGLATVGWDVDPRDWSRPGTGAIYDRVVSAVRNGSIVLMHDGGGPRDETVAALAEIIRTLQARGYRIVTVSELLGYKPVYRS